MRIRLFRAFASNNSGSYTLVGHFETLDGAREAEEALARVCAVYSAWLDETKGVSDGDSPLERFAREYDLHASLRAGLPGGWPEYGPSPRVARVAFPDLVAGVSVVRDLAEAHSVSVQVRLHEALGNGDPLASMRPGG